MNDEKAFNVQLGQRLRRSRVLHGWSQSYIAEKMDITFQQVQKYESGANGLSAAKMVMLAGLLGEPVAYFYEVQESTVEPPINRQTLQLIRQLQTVKHNQPMMFMEIVRLLSALLTYSSQ